MDQWKYFDITHKQHLICNPLSSEKLDTLIGLFDLAPGSQVLDVAMGKGELITRLVERYGVEGVAVDLSPYCVADTEAKLQGRVPGATVKVLEMDGADYRPEAPASFDLAACLGASWIFGGHKGTLASLEGIVRSGGLILVGEPYWRQEPPAPYLAVEGWERDTFGSHYENVQVGEELGLSLEYAITSTLDEWDRYEGLQWHAAATYARAHPDDPDLSTLQERIRRSRERYLRWGRATVGWAAYLFRS